jgi:hypothetical protein
VRTTNLVSGEYCSFRDLTPCSLVKSNISEWSTASLLLLTEESMIPQNVGNYTPHYRLFINVISEVFYYYYYYYYCLLTQVFPVFLSLNQWCTSPLKLHLRAVALVCSMFPGRQFFAMNLWNACLVFLPGTISVLWLLFLWLQWLLASQNTSCSTFAGFLCIIFIF